MAAALPTPVTVPGLERLMQLATVNVHQTSSGYNGNNYTVFSEDEVLFTMDEEVPDTCFRGGANRPFIFDGVENTGRKVFRFRRPTGCLLISEKVELYLNDQLVSVIRMERTCMTPLFSINDPQEQPVIRLKGKISEIAIFQLQTKDKVPIGSMHKQWRGWKKELFSFKNDFIINFPADLALQYKLGVIVACVFIDFRYFEGK